MSGSDTENLRLDNAARAAWLYFMCGNTQEEIAQELKISRPTAQRLISFALSEHLIAFRIHHPIAECMELTARLTARFGLKFCDVVPSDVKDPTSVASVSASAAAYIEKRLAEAAPIMMALGTGRTLRAAVQQVRPMNCPHHTLISLVGNVASDGSVSPFGTLSNLAELTGARAYPMFMPVLAEDAAERNLLVTVQLVRRLHAMAARADVTLVGVGQLDFEAQQFRDGFISREELVDLMRAGAIGEIVGWAYDGQGRVLDGDTNLRITSAPHRPEDDRLVIGVAVGPAKVPSIHAALTGRLLTGLITDVGTARAILDRAESAVA